MTRAQTAKAWVADMLSREAGPDALAYHLALLLKKERADEREAAAKDIEVHCCVSSCCDAQPSAGEAKALADCIRRRASQPGGAVPGAKGGHDG